MEKFLVMLAKSPMGTAVKVGIGAGCAWALANIELFNLSPSSTTIVIAFVTVIINAVNPLDDRYGKGSE